MALRLALQGKNTPVYIENVRLWIPDFNAFTYTHVMVMAGKHIYCTNNQTTVTNPLTIIEVLSDSTRDYDRSRKFYYYRSVKSLQEYVLVEQEKPLVMLYCRN